MAEHAQEAADRRRGPLHDLPPVQGGAAIRLQTLGFRTLLNLRCRPEEGRVVASLADVLGAPLPLEPNRWTGRDERAVIWLGPDEWLILAADGEAEDIEARIRAVAGHDPWLSLVDLSHSYTGLTLSGTAARDVLAKGCPLDLHRRSFGGGDCAQTVLAGTRVLLRHTERTEAIELWIRNSFACYAAAWLSDAMAEFST